ncbi:MAG: transporter permease [Sphaerisporangium sp.]|nr:transporter permease [Sphaerisporangium sp.]
MIRFAWLQSRTQTLVAAFVLAALAVVAAITGIQLSHLYATLVAHCHTGCDLATSQYLSHDQVMARALDLIAQAAPALIGLFWGAPLIAREIETGTYRLAWTQGVSRSRWVIIKLAVVGLASATLAGLLTLTITWWYGSVDKLTTTPYAVFDRRDITPVGYAVFAFAAGALLGTVIRRVLPAMAATLGAYVAARVGTALWIRPHLLSPIQTTLSLRGAGPTGQAHLGVGSQNGGAVTLFAQGDGPHNSWTLSSHLLDSAGRQPTTRQLAAFLHDYCPNFRGPGAPPPSGQGVVQVVGPDAGRPCLDQAAKAFHLLVTYQPADRYWTLQWLETGLFVALALVASAGCYWWATHRTS